LADFSPTSGHVFDTDSVSVVVVYNMYCGKTLITTFDIAASP